MPPTPSSGPASPALSEQESVSEEEQSSDKGADGGAVVEGEKEEVKKGEYNYQFLRKMAFFAFQSGKQVPVLANLGGSTRRVSEYF